MVITTKPISNSIPCSITTNSLSNFLFPPPEAALGDFQCVCVRHFRTFIKSWSAALCVCQCKFDLWEVRPYRRGPAPHTHELPATLSWRVPLIAPQHKTLLCDHRRCCKELSAEWDFLAAHRMLLLCSRFWGGSPESESDRNARGLSKCPRCNRDENVGIWQSWHFSPFRFEF